MPYVSTKVALAAAAAGALACHVDAFAPSPSTAALRGGVASRARASARGVLALRANQNADDAARMQQQGFNVEIDTDTLTRDPSGSDQIEVKGAFVEDGWVDESAIKPAGGNFFSNLFGSKPAESPFGKKRTPGVSKANLSKDLDKIEYLDGTTGSLKEAEKAGTAVPFGGLNPNQVAIYREQKQKKTIELMNLPEGRFVMYPGMRQEDAIKAAEAAKQQAAAQPAAAQNANQQLADQIAALPEGWFTAYDETTQSEYYYNEAGESRWDRPVTPAK